MSHSNGKPRDLNGSTSLRNRLLVLVVVLAAVIVAYVQFGDRLTLESLAASESQLRQFRTDHPILVYGIPRRQKPFVMSATSSTAHGSHR